MNLVDPKRREKKEFQFVAGRDCIFSQAVKYDVTQERK